MEDSNGTQKKKGRSPAFQLYTEKALAGSDHLKPQSFKAYWKTLWWMWSHAPDYCSIPDTDAAWESATGLTGKTLKTVRAEIMPEHMPLLKRVTRKGRADKLISNGLKKEADKQGKRSKQMKDAAKKRWHKGLRAMPKHKKRDAYASKEADTPEDSTEFCKAHPQYAVLVESPHFRGAVTPEDYLKILQTFPGADERRAVRKATDTADLIKSGIDEPALFLRAQFSKDELGKTGGDTRRSTLPASRKKKQKKAKAPF